MLQLSAPVAQWIEQARPKGKMGVRFPPGVPIFCAAQSDVQEIGTAQVNESLGSIGGESFL
jgi:hypothetical protein